jgi:hypothetical protein
MLVVSKIELKLEDFEKCFTTLDSDCPLGKLYDYSCALKHFVLQKMQELEKPPEEKKSEEKV